MTSIIPTSSPLSSAQSSEATFRTASPEASPRYQQAQPLPFELLSHIRIYFEENFYGQTFQFLLSLATSSVRDHKRKVLLPPPQYLAVAASIAVHPTFTSRALTEDKRRYSNLALQYLRTVARIVGPVNAQLTEAYRFRKFDTLLPDVDEDDDNPNNNRLATVYAGSDSLFNTKDDFWAVVGWALNCSCLSGMHATRWSYWCSFLEHMLEVLERDWEQGEELGLCHQTILWQYISSATGGNARARRILRAIFANGNQSSLIEFGEVFRKELKEPKSLNDDTKKQDVVVDIDHDIYGDWMQRSNSSTDEEDKMQVDEISNRPSKRQKTRAPSARRRQTPRPGTKSMLTDTEDSDASGLEDSATKHTLGPPKSVSIRLRLLQLLSAVSARPSLTDLEEGSIFPDIHELYTLFTEFIRPLPLPVFCQLILPNASLTDLIPDVRVNLCDFILHRVAENENARRYSLVESMTQKRLIEEYLPYAASTNSVEMQAKMSLLIESVLRQLSRDGVIIASLSSSLVQAVNDGIAKRNKRVKDIQNSVRYRKGANRDEEELAKEMLDESIMRIKLVLSQLG